MNPFRLGLALVVAAVALIVITVGVFWFFFHDQVVSSDISQWGSFGDYLGGVLGVSLSTLALIGAVIAIYQQQRADQRTKNAAIASDFVRSLERLEDSVDGALKQCPIELHFTDSDITINADAYDVLTNIALQPVITASVIPRYSVDAEQMVAAITDKRLTEQQRHQRIKLYELFSTTCGKLQFIKDLLGKHEKLSDHNAVSLYYQRKYRVAVRRLRDAGYTIDSWDEAPKQ